MACASPVPELRGDTLLTSATKLPQGRSLYSNDLLGNLRPRGTQWIEEVGLERSRTSQRYREHLQRALAVLLRWVTLTASAAVDWLGDPLLTNQVLGLYWIDVFTAISHTGFLTCFNQLR